MLGDQDAADRFLREHLPSEVIELITSDPPEPVPGSFVDAELRQHHSDLLLRIQLNSGQDAFAYVLLEHKSSSDPAVRLQLLRYILRILVTWYEQHDKRLPLPPVLPVLVHQGPRGLEDLLRIRGPVRRGPSGTAAPPAFLPTCAGRLGLHCR